MLNDIWISKDYRGKGLSSKCKDELFAWFKKNNCNYINLSVLDANNAKHIYKKWGFKTVLNTMVKFTDFE
jgi:GNAT superfamily N-acetyltransferase